MKIAFFGIYYACNYYHIGGTDSFVRRISNELINNNHAVDYILYGNEKEETIIIEHNLKMYYYNSFHDAWKALLQSNYDHVITMYLPPIDRFIYSYYRKKIHKRNLYFHKVYFSWPDNVLKREMTYIDSRIFPYNGNVFTISPRQFRKVSKWSNRVSFLLPPVDNSYFTTPSEKLDSKKLRVSWIGRLDPGKGALEVIELFKFLSTKTEITLTMCGHRWDEHKNMVSIQNYLKEQDSFEYINTDYYKHTKKIDDQISNILLNTDVFILPYRRLSSTIDMPLLLLEAMAALAVVCTKPMGNIPEIYGDSDLLIPDNDNYIEVLKDRILNLNINRLKKERSRIFKRNLKLKFKTKDVVNKFIKSLNNI